MATCLAYPIRRKEIFLLNLLAEVDWLYFCDGYFKQDRDGQIQTGIGGIIKKIKEL